MENINDSIKIAIGSVRPDRPKRVPTARDCMVTSLMTLQPDQPVKEAIRLFLKHRISGAPVVDESYRLVGMLSEMDCLRNLASAAYSGEFFDGSKLVRELMTKKVISVSPDTNIYSMSELFGKHSIRRLPVVEDDVVVGQVSRRDILKTIQDS